MKLLKRVLVSVLILIVALVLISLGSYWLLPISDMCMDSGGSYNYETCTCDYENSQPYKETHQCKKLFELW